MSTSGERIVVGVDGSAWSRKALRVAARIAAVLDAPLVAVTVWDVVPGRAGYGADDGESSHAQARGALDDAVAEVFGERPPDRLARRLLRGRPQEQLVAAGRGAQMLVVGRRGTGGAGALLLGSVSSACLVHASCPVLVVREDPTVRD